jgi:hypothetical protein
VQPSHPPAAQADKKDDKVQTKESKAWQLLGVITLALLLCLLWFFRGENDSCQQRRTAAASPGDGGQHS